MADPPLVSAITIFLNAERFLEEAIASVFAQTYGRWELLLVDDGSSDGSSVIARRYVAAHPDRVRYLEHPGHANRGMSAARNLGIRYARGAYVAFLDADDVWLPEKLERQTALLEANPEAGMVMGASWYWHGWTGRAENAQRDRLVPVGAPQNTLIHPPALLTTLYPLGAGAAPCVASLLIRRGLLDAVGGFEEGFRGINQLYEDQAFLTQAYLKAPVFVTSLCSDRYRQHEESCVATVNRDGHYRAVRESFLTWFEGHLTGQGESRPEVWRALHAALAPYRRPGRWALMQLCRDPLGTLRRSSRPFLARWLRALLDAPRRSGPAGPGTRVEHR